MGFRIFSRIVVIAGMVFGLAGCGGGGTPNTPGSGSTTPISPTGATLSFILVTSAAASLPKGLTEQFIATGIYSDGTKQNLTAQATWSSSNSAAATIISNSGVATTVAAGNTNITATAGTITSSSYPLTVTPAELNFIAITPPSPTLGVGQTAQFTATGTYSDGATLDLTSNIFWDSSNLSIAAVNSTTTTPVGLATGVAPGTVIVTASNPSTNPIFARTTLTVANYGVSGLLSLLPGGNSVVLQNNSADNLTLTTNGTFMFNTPLASGASYNVSVLTQPTGAVHPCNVVNGSGTITTAYITSVQVVCATAVGTFAGSANVYGASNGTGTSAQFYSPSDVAVDSTGNVYVADTANQLIRKITPLGVVSTLAGTAGMAGSVNGLGTAASFFNPKGVAVDTSGNVYVADSGNNMIRKITPSGTVTTWAGSGAAGATNATGISASFKTPNGVAVDSAGNVYVGDSGNNLIRKISTTQVVTTFAGIAGTTGSTNGASTAATFNSPIGVAVDAAGTTVYVADSINGLIRKISAGNVSTFAGGLMGSYVDGPALTARFFYPTHVTVESTGNVYVADTGNNLIRKITAGNVTTYAGLTHYMGSSSGTPGFHDGPAWIDASLLSAAFSTPNGVAVDTSGNVYVADNNNHLIRKILP